MTKNALNPMDAIEDDFFDLAEQMEELVDSDLPDHLVVGGRPLRGVSDAEMERASALASGLDQVLSVSSRAIQLMVAGSLLDRVADRFQSEESAIGGLEPDASLAVAAYLLGRSMNRTTDDAVRDLMERDAEEHGDEEIPDDAEFADPEQSDEPAPDDRALHADPDPHRHEAAAEDEVRHAEAAEDRAAPGAHVARGAVGTVQSV